MDFFKAVLRDIIIYTIPFVAARITIFPLINLNARMQKNYRKVEEESNLKEKYQKYQNFSPSAKIECLKDIASISGVRGIYEKWENYVIPFGVSRIAEGIVYFPLMRILLDHMKFEDPLYLLSGLVFSLINVIGSFFLKFVGDIVRNRKNFKSAIELLYPSNLTFWRQYEVELGCYHAYGMIQGYIQMVSFYYLKPSLRMEVVLYAISRITAALSVQPLTLLVIWASDHEYDHGRLIKQITKRDGIRGLYAGSRDLILNEIIFASVLIPGCHLMASLI